MIKLATVGQQEAGSALRAGEGKGHLPLAALDPPRVDVGLLEPGKVELTWSDVVTVRT